MKLPFFMIGLAFIPAVALAQSTSPNPNVEPSGPSIQILERAFGPTDIITFSEFPVGTFITNQYADHGVIFGGDSPFISVDGSNPTSPVLSGSPRFFGSIEGHFVDPDDGTTPVIVQSFSLDAGFFNELSSTRIEWFDPKGNKLGQRTNSQLGIENVVIEGGNIARWRTGIIATEPAGYAIDNVSITPAQASILFREKSDSEKDGSWGFIGDDIPGFDHVGFHLNNFVYESHPGYPSGTYVSEDGGESVSVANVKAVQSQHTKETFKHYAVLAGAQNSPVIDFEEIPIDTTLAENMRNHIENQINVGAGFQFIETGTFQDISDTLSPSAQKGGGGTFTCVGLVEWAAEQAGHNGGEGFIRNAFESYFYLDLTVFPPEIREFPFLTPHFLSYAMKGALTLATIQQWFQGGFDPVDFVITDPLGRKLGFVLALGEINEIPKAFFSGNGEFEQFFIPNPVAGTYEIELVGLGEQVVGAVASSLAQKGVNILLPVGETEKIMFEVELVAGAPGDVNGDGSIDEQDADELSENLNTFTNNPNDPGDIDGDGILSEADLVLLEELIAAVQVRKVEIDIKPNKVTNSVNPRRGGVIPVAILTTDTFDATTVDPLSVEFGPSGAVEAHGRGHIEDVDGDGDLDLLLHFTTRDTGIVCGDTNATLDGKTLDGQAIGGGDSIKTVSCK